MSVTLGRPYCRFVLTFSRPREEEPHHCNLQSCHCHHHKHFDQAKVEYPLLRAPDRAEIAVFSCPKVFLHAADRAQLARDLEDQVLESRMLFTR